MKKMFPRRRKQVTFEHLNNSQSCCWKCFLGGGKDFKMWRYCTFILDDNRYICVWTVTYVIQHAFLCASVYSILADTMWVYVSDSPWNVCSLLWILIIKSQFSEFICCHPGCLHSLYIVCQLLCVSCLQALVMGSFKTYSLQWWRVTSPFMMSIYGTVYRDFTLSH